MADSYLGEIRMFAGNYPPIDWEFCNGQLLSIARYDSLFALIGTTYGGDGVNNFALPDLRRRIPVNQGQGSGLSNRLMGQRGTPNGSMNSMHSQAVQAAGGNNPHNNMQPYLGLNFIIALEGIFPPHD